MCPELPPGFEASIRAATWSDRVEFRHPDPAQWWRECCAMADAALEAAAEPAGPSALVARAAALLHELADVLSRPCGPGADTLRAICQHAPVGGATLERAGREALPLLAAAAAELRRHIALAEETSPAHAEPIARRMVHELADLYAEAFRYRGRGLEEAAPARATHGDAVKGSPFARWVEALLAARAAAFTEAHGIAAPTLAVTPKMLRLAPRTRRRSASR